MADLEEAFGSLAPPDRRDPHLWAEDHRWVVEGTSEQPGRWRSRPYQVEPLETFGQPDFREGVFLSCSQGGGKTEVLLTLAAYCMKADPGPILLVRGTVDLAKAFSKDRFQPMVRAMPVLREIVRDPREKFSGSTILHKVFPGGHADLVGANSAHGLSDRPVRYLLTDELRGWPDDAGGEGDPLTIVLKRTEGYLYTSKRFHASSASSEGDRLHRLWQRTDQREWCVPCPSCDEEQPIAWGDVRFKDEREVRIPARWQCRACGDLHGDAARWAAIKRGRYVAQEPENDIPGWRLPAMAILGRRLEAIVDEWYAVQGSPTELKAFIQTVLCEFYNEYGKTDFRPRWHVPLQHDFGLVPPVEVPEEVFLLTLGIDVQADFLPYELVGWGWSDESWSLRWSRWIGDLKRTSAPLDQLEQLLARPFMREDGAHLYVRAACMDTQGHASQQIYPWIKPRLVRYTGDGMPQFLFGTKGFGVVHGQEGPLWPDKEPNRRRKYLGLPFPVPLGVNEGKDQIMGRLRIVEPGPGRCHFPPDREDGYFKELVAERARWARGRRQWVERSPGAANDALDCRVLAYAAKCAVVSKGFDVNLADEAARVLETAGMPLPDPPGGAAPPAAATVAPKRQRRRGRRGGSALD